MRSVKEFCMTTLAFARAARTGARPRDVTVLLPHWSDVAPYPPAPESRQSRPRPAPAVAAQLSDLVRWTADIAIRLTHECPEDRTAIAEVRRTALAWLAGEPCPEVDIEDVLTTVAVLLSAIDLNLDRSEEDHDPCPSNARVAT
jgi:hypothetical protein